MSIALPPMQIQKNTENNELFHLLVRQKQRCRTYYLVNSSYKNNKT